MIVDLDIGLVLVVGVVILLCLPLILSILKYDGGNDIPKVQLSPRERYVPYHDVAGVPTTASASPSEESTDYTPDETLTYFNPDLCSGTSQFYVTTYLTSSRNFCRCLYCGQNNPLNALHCEHCGGRLE